MCLHNFDLIYSEWKTNNLWAHFRRQNQLECVLLRISLTCVGIWTRFRFFFSIVLFCTPSRLCAVAVAVEVFADESIFFFFFLHDSGFGCFFFFFFLAIAAPVGSVTGSPSLVLITFNFFSSAVPNLNDLFILNSTALRLSSDGCSSTGVFLWRYRIGWPGFLRRYSCSSRSWLAITYRLFFIWNMSTAKAIQL